MKKYQEATTDATALASTNNKLPLFPIALTW